MTRQYRYIRVERKNDVFCVHLRQPKLDVLVVGAGGGREIEQFLPSNPKWRLVGVDPSRDMLGLAQNAAERLGVQERVELVHGTIDSLPADRQFDAVTCLYVLHFLPDDAKLALLRGIAARLRPLHPAGGARPKEYHPIS